MSTYYVKLRTVAFLLVESEVINSKLYVLLCPVRTFPQPIGGTREP